MVSKVLRYVSVPLVALCALPVIWTSPADATFVSCLAGRSKTAPTYGANTTFSTECQYQLSPTQTDVAGKARSIGNTGVESNLTWATNASSPHAYAFGKRTGQSGLEQIPGCVADDTTADGAWKSKTCTGGFVVGVSLVVNAN